MSDQQWDGQTERRGAERVDHARDIDLLFGMIRTLHARIDEQQSGDLESAITLAEMRGDVKRIVVDIENIKTAAVALGASMLEFKMLKWQAAGGVRTIAITAAVVAALAGSVTWLISTYAALHH